MSKIKYFGQQVKKCNQLCIIFRLRRVPSKSEHHGKRYLCVLFSLVDIFVSCDCTNRLISGGYTQAICQGEHKFLLYLMTSFIFG